MRLAWVLLGLSLLACTSDGGTAAPPAPAYPDVGGVYALTGAFDGVAGSTFSGTLTVDQPDRDAPDLRGFVSIALDRDPSSRVDGPLTGGTVSLNGHVVFEVGQGSASTYWRFDGAGDGAAGGASATRLTGRHTLSADGRVRAGTWVARR